MKENTRETEILKVIKERQNISRLELAKIFNLTPARISSLTKGLIEKKIVLEKSLGISTGGRKPVILAINEENFGSILGIHLAPTEVYMSIGKIDGEITKREKYSLKEVKEEDVLGFITKLISHTLESEEGIGAISLVMTGFLDDKKGTVILSSHYKLKDLNIVKYLEDQFCLPVLLENDVRGMALSEKQIGSCKNVSDFIILNVSEGIGTCLVINDEIYKGFSSTAGEIGHTSINTHSIRKCSCGKRGCLEAESSNTAIIKKITSDIKLGKYSILKDVLEKKKILDISDILVGVKKRDFLSVQVINEAMEYIAQGLNIIISLINPEKIILVGSIFTNKFIMDTLRFELRKLSLEFQQCTIEPTKLKDDIFYYSPIGVVIKNIFENEEFTEKYLKK